MNRLSDRRTTFLIRRAGQALALAGLMALLFQAGCAHTPEPRFYTLDMSRSGAAQPTCNIEVDRLRPHDALTRTDIMVKKSPTQIEYYALDRWAAGLGEVVPEKLRAEFGPQASDRKTVVLSGEILAFEQVDTPSGAEGHIKLDLSFRNEDMSRYETPLLKKEYEVSVPAQNPTPADVVVALSEGLAKVAAEIARDANTL